MCVMYTFYFLLCYVYLMCVIYYMCMLCINFIPNNENIIYSYENFYKNLEQRVNNP